MNKYIDGAVLLLLAIMAFILYNTNRSMQATIDKNTIHDLSCCGGTFVMKKDDPTQLDQTFDKIDQHLIAIEEKLDRKIADKEKEAVADSSVDFSNWGMSWEEVEDLIASIETEQSSEMIEPDKDTTIVYVEPVEENRHHVSLLRWNLFYDSPLPPSISNSE